jgi:hypothetical protein
MNATNTDTPPTVMREHDPNDDPFAALSQEEPTLSFTPLMESGSAGGAGARTIDKKPDEKEEAPSGEESSSSVEKEA